MLLIYFQDDLTIIRSTVGAATLIVLFRFPDDRDLNRYSGSTGSKDPVMLPEKICDDTEIGQQLNNRIKIHASSFPVCIHGPVGKDSSNQEETGTSAY